MHIFRLIFINRYLIFKLFSGDFKNLDGKPDCQTASRLVASYINENISLSFFSCSVFHFFCCFLYDYYMLYFYMLLKVSAANNDLIKRKSTSYIW